VWGDRAQYIVLPMADGGEGTVAAFIAAGARAVPVRVHDALGGEVDATYARDGATAIVEMAAASGLAPLGDRRAPCMASTAGTGELVRAALDAGAERIVLGIGGSATTDGGAGALAALGARFLDAAGTALEPVPAALASLAGIDLGALDPRLATTPIDIASDVDNPLLGPRGAAAVYGPQKGASAADVAFLDAFLTRFAAVAAAASGRDLRTLPGSGAAGGLGYGLATFAAARLRRGVDIIADVRGLSEALGDAAACFTGEGSIDAQTLDGKVVAGVAERARIARVPVIALCGRVEPAVEARLWQRGVTCVPVADGPRDLASSLLAGSALIRAAASRCARLRPLPA
jgi:glycerate kinase